MTLHATDTTAGSRAVGPDVPERILLATDGARAALAATRWTAARVTHRPAIVTVTYLAGDLHRAPFLAAGPTHAEHVAWQEREYLHELAPTATLRTQVLTGPRDRALRDAASIGTDLLVLGSNRVDGKPELPVSSISTVVAAAPVVPTVVVPRDWTQADGAVVVGIDADIDDPRVVSFAADEAARLRTDLVLAHGWHVPWGRHPALLVTSDEQAWRISAERRLEAMVVAVASRHPGLTVRSELRHGRPVEVLADVAQGAALLVVGAHRLTPDSPCLLGPVGRAVVEAPPCAVAVVPAGVR
jgi:nucleotide-binding universal stress UspA family protein